MRGNLFYIVHPAGQLKELNRRAALGELEEKLEALHNAIEKLDPSECTAAVRRLSRGIDRILGVIQRAHSKAGRGFVRVLDEEGSGNGS